MFDIFRKLYNCALQINAPPVITNIVKEQMFRCAQHDKKVIPSRRRGTLRFAQGDISASSRAIFSFGRLLSSERFLSLRALFVVPSGARNPEIIVCRR